MTELSQMKVNASFQLHQWMHMRFASATPAPFLLVAKKGSLQREEEDEDVIFVLRGIHPSSEFVAAFPEGTV